MEINLISDTVTKPTAEMLQFMMQAKVGDDGYKKDPTVNELEAKVAEMFGKEAALFFPSGTMANQAAIKLHTQPGDQVICEKRTHIYMYEGGGLAFNSGVSCKLLDGEKGKITAELAKTGLNNPNSIHEPLSRMVSIENTTNVGGGSCYEFDEILKLRAFCDNYNLGYHLDGARLWNAMVAKSQTAKQFGEVFDTISVCLSKGLGAPIGSVLVGSQKDMDKAIRIRKVLGGCWRQAGYLAAAGIYALDHHIDRLADDHRRAKELENVLNKLEFVESVDEVETNIVFFSLKNKEKDSKFVANLKEHNILMSEMGYGKLRIVTHLDYTEEMHQTVISVLESMKLD